MQMRNLYPEFFDGRERYRAYGEETEYWKDMYRALDIALTAAVLEKAHKKNGSERIVRELESYKLSQPDEFPTQTVAAALNSARLHIKSRLRFTEKTCVFRFRYLVLQLGLSQWESFLLLLSFAVSFDAKYEQLFADLQGDARYKLPTVRLAVTLYQYLEPLGGEEMADVLQKRGVLFSCFFETVQTEGQHPMMCMFSLTARACAYLYGRNDVERSLLDLTELYCYKDTLKPLLIRQAKEQHITACLVGAMQSGQKGNVLQLYGPDGIGKKFLLKHAAAKLSANILFVDAAKLLSGTLAEQRVLFLRLKLESILLGALLCFYGYDPPRMESELEEQKNTPQGLRFLLNFLRTECIVSIWLAKEKADCLSGHGLMVFYTELPILSAGERLVLWEAFAAEKTLAPDVNLQMCASKYVLSPDGILRVLHTATLLAAADGVQALTNRHIREAVAQQSVNQLGRSATLVRSVYTWDDFVVSDEQRAQMEMVCNQIKYRDIVGEQWGFHKKTAYGRGVCALFYGAPGTGKTMAVQVIANELGLDLYRIDLSQIVSKYIGETEKNISDLFYRAKNTNALLFFDEADSLFAKRSEVRDSHDRNANAETAHLLQKLEDYEGITILATNYVNNIDDAFRRRIKFMVNFTFPTPDVRLQLWQTIFPKETPVEEELDFEFFANKFELSGSSIKEILTNAAYTAAADGRGMKNADLVRAVKLNFAKYGKILNQEDFEYLA